MRAIRLGALTAIAAFAGGVSPSFAQVYPWCAVYTDGDRSCSFESLAQCRMTATPGSGARCEQNVLYKPPAAEAQPAPAPTPAKPPPPARKRSAKPAAPPPPQPQPPPQ